MRREGGPTAACCPLPPTGLSWPAQDSRAPYKSLPPLVPPSPVQPQVLSCAPVSCLCAVCVAVGSGSSCGGCFAEIGEGTEGGRGPQPIGTELNCCCVISSSDVKERCPSEYHRASAASIRIHFCYLSDLLSVALTSVEWQGGEGPHDRSTTVPLQPEKQGIQTTYIPCETYVCVPMWSLAAASLTHLSSTSCEHTSPVGRLATAIDAADARMGAALLLAFARHSSWNVSICGQSRQAAEAGAE